MMPRIVRPLLGLLLLIFAILVVQLTFVMMKYESVPYHKSHKYNMEADEDSYAIAKSETSKEHTSVQFDAEGKDVLVFQHIQKTGGSFFEDHLLDINGLPCQCAVRKGRKGPCKCQNSRGERWMFSRKTTQWGCGLHADFSHLIKCVPKYLNANNETRTDRVYHYLTVLRDPVYRFLSEWHHTNRGATWGKCHYTCNGPMLNETGGPKCYTGENWAGVTLEEFINCPYNIANNRQTYMLAHIADFGCEYLRKMPQKVRDKLILEDAKNNLMRFAYFSINEYQPESQYLFEKTFGLKFNEPFDNKNTFGRHQFEGFAKEEQKKKIKELNYLDVQLYEFAKDLFLKRIEQAKAKSSKK